jgi:3-hydroxybutyryl-CoA dehydrogenase
MATKTLTLGVIGTGTMGCGIAQVAAQCGYPVLFQNRKQDAVDKGLSKIEKALGGHAAKGKLSAAQVEAIRENIRGVVPLEELKGCDILLESAPEDLELKRDLFQKLDGILAEDSILASNTSSLSITKLASFTRRPGHVVGMHFFNPVPMMKLVEVVAGLNTSDSTVSRARTFAEDLGKVAVDVKDAPGFVVNRVLFPMINEAAFALQEQVSDAKGIDECMKLGCNHPMGPLALADLVGLDVVYAILDSLYREYGEPRYRPCLEIKKRVEAGWLGRKSGRGFYHYDS